MRHVTPIYWALSLSAVVSAGCTQNPNANSRVTFPWQRQAPLGSNPTAPTGSLFSDLQRRTSDQERLLKEQQRQLARLADLQRLNDEQALATRQRQQQSQWQQVQRDRELATQQQRELGSFDELRQRTLNLDTNNRDLHTQLARSQQQNQLMQDQVKLLQQRLSDTANQLAQMQQAQQSTSQQFQALQASSRRRANASISANNSLTRNLTAVDVPGMEVRQDGDLVRIGIPAERLFVEQTATLHQGATPYMDQVAEVVRRNYPQQVVGIEAYSDNAPVTGTLWRSKHQLTAAQAMAVFEQLTQRQGVSSQQFFVLGHGENHPLASNATPAGQARNRRVEVVIYPETYTQR